MVVLAITDNYEHSWIFAFADQRKEGIMLMQKAEKESLFFKTRRQSCFDIYLD